MSSPIEELYDFTLEIYCGYRSWPDDIETYCQVTYPPRGNQEAITIDYTDSLGELDTFISRAAQDIAAYMKDPQEWTENYIAHSSDEWRQLKQAQEDAEEYRQETAKYQRAAIRAQEQLKESEAKVAALQAKLGIKPDRD